MIAPSSVCVALSAFAASDDLDIATVDVPRVRVEGSSEGEAELEVGFGFPLKVIQPDTCSTRPKKRTFILALRVDASAETQLGRATVVSVANPGANDSEISSSTSGFLGANLILYRSKSLSVAQFEQVQMVRKSSVERALMNCKLDCSSASMAQDKWCKDNKDLRYRDGLDDTNICPWRRSEVQTAIRRESLSVGVSAYPTFTTVLGARVGVAPFSYRDTATDPLVDEGVVEVPWDAGALFTGVIPTTADIGVSLEGRLGWSKTYSASDTRVQWCVPAGNVDLGPDPDDANERVTAEGLSCDSAPLGAPTARDPFIVGGRVGVVSTLAKYRLGAEVVVELDGKDDRVSIGAPVLINVSRNGAKYKGLIELKPRFLWRELAEQEEANVDRWAFFLDIVLLGQRSIFSESYRTF